MKNKHARAHMRAAFVYADLSQCKRKKVGCVIVKNNTPIAIGFNGTPSGEDNCCEDDNDTTKSNVIHAEDNALRKLVRSHESSIGAFVFVTAAPCKRCAEKLVDAGVVKVFYHEIYHGKTTSMGLDHLTHHGIAVELLEIK